MKHHAFSNQILAVLARVGAPLFGALAKSDSASQTESPPKLLMVSPRFSNWPGTRQRRHHLQLHPKLRARSIISLLGYCVSGEAGGFRAHRKPHAGSAQKTGRGRRPAVGSRGSVATVTPPLRLPQRRLPLLLRQLCSFLEDLCHLRSTPAYPYYGYSPYYYGPYYGGYYATRTTTRSSALDSVTGAMDIRAVPWLRGSVATAVTRGYYGLPRRLRRLPRRGFGVPTAAAIADLL